MRRWLLRFLALAFTAAGCGADLRPAVFPSEARLGSTVALTLDGNQIEKSEHLDRNDVSRENVRIWIEDASYTLVEISPIRSVFYGGTQMLGSYEENRPGAWVAVALFDLPGDLGFSSYDPPPERQLIVEFNGDPNDTSATFIKITGEGGSPQQFFPVDQSLITVPYATPIESALEPHPTLRIRADANAGAFKWQDGNGDLIPIGAIEMVVAYPSCVSNPKAQATSDAHRATVLLDDAAGTAKLLLLDPTGFTLPKTPKQNAAAPGHSFRGGGPIIEVAFDKSCAFDASQFDITSLLVADTMGDVLLDERQEPSSLQHFALYTLVGD